MLAVGCLHAQNPIPDQKTIPANQQQTGTIEGHVICEDTRSPARLATVLVIPIPIFDASGNATRPRIKGGNIAKTNLDGNYTLAKVTPGDYFVVAELQGYPSPITQVPWDDLNDPTPDSIKKLTKLLTSVHVEPGKTTHADQVLERGASISGMVTYDDGAPAIGAAVLVEPAQAGPEKQSWSWSFTGLYPELRTRTDDRGRYRISGLPDGDYVVEASADVAPHENNPFAASEGSFDANPYFLGTNKTYSERALHRRSAKVYKEALGEDLSGANIEIPLHGLYSISWYGHSPGRSTSNRLRICVAPGHR